MGDEKDLEMASTLLNIKEEKEEIDTVEEVNITSSTAVPSSVPKDAASSESEIHTIPPSTSFEADRPPEVKLKLDTRSTDEIKHELSDFVKFNKDESTKRKRCKEDEDTFDLTINIFLRSMYPLNENMDKTVTVGIFKSLNFKPAVLLNQCGKSSLLLAAHTWDRFTKYISIIEAYLYNNLSGKKTAIGFDDSDIEVDNIRLRGVQYVRFRDLSKHNKKILLTFEEFHVLSSLTPAIVRYIEQLVAYSPIIIDYLNSSINKNPGVPLIYGPIDNSIYNRLPQEVLILYKN